MGAALQLTPKPINAENLYDPREFAPLSQSSGKWQGKARIQGGRPNLRHAIFMPALVAIRHNADLKAKYEQLVAAGKEKKVAITAVMRKMLVLANALLRNHRKWGENTA